MPKKTGAGGEPQSYDKATGRYSELSERAKSTEKSIKDFEGLSAEQTKQKILDGTESIKSEILTEEDSKTFHNAITRAKESNSLETRWRVDIHSEEDYRNDKLFLSKGGSCVAVEPNGNIISVCKNQNDTVMGKDLLKHAVKNGGDRLDAFGERLFAFYTKNGFEPVSWTPFNIEYAPDDWKTAKEKGLM